MNNSSVQMIFGGNRKKDKLVKQNVRLSSLLSEKCLSLHVKIAISIHMASTCTGTGQQHMSGDTYNPPVVEHPMASVLRPLSNEPDDSFVHA
ncbi:GD14924 [Drosophila simulans]|uniref:GD14924 n=1 Tax=Drosophila simulans TaxID=7240 RepID=B4QJL6_DROSI|nr:GD14924 [Drosophila simulans]